MIGKVWEKDPIQNVMRQTREHSLPSSSSYCYIYVRLCDNSCVVICSRLFLLFLLLQRYKVLAIVIRPDTRYVIVPTMYKHTPRIIKCLLMLIRLLLCQRAEDLLVRGDQAERPLVLVDVRAAPAASSAAPERARVGGVVEGVEKAAGADGAGAHAVVRPYAAAGPGSAAAAVLLAVADRLKMYVGNEYD